MYTFAKVADCRRQYIIIVITFDILVIQIFVRRYGTEHKVKYK